MNSSISLPSPTLRKDDTEFGIPSFESDPPSTAAMVAGVQLWNLVHYLGFEHTRSVHLAQIVQATLDARKPCGESDYAELRDQCIKAERRVKELEAELERASR